MFWDLRLSASVAKDSDLLVCTLRRLVVKLQTFRWSIVASSSGSRSPRTFDTSCRPVRQESLDRLDCHALLFCSRQNIPTDCQVVSWQFVGMLWRGMLCMPYVCPQRKTVFAVACIKWHKQTYADFSLNSPCIFLTVNSHQQMHKSPIKV